MITSVALLNVCCLKMSISKLLNVGLFLLVTVLFREVKCSCQLRIDNVNKPLLTQQFGSNEIIVEGIDSIDLDEGVAIQAYCASGFMPFYIRDTNMNYRYYNEDKKTYNSANERIIKFYCRSDKVRFRKPFDASIPPENSELIMYEQKIPKCKGAMYAMFESRTKLQNCEDASSYVLGADLNTPIIIVGLCYNLDRLKLKYVSYKLHESSSILNKLKQFYPMGVDDNSLAYHLKSIDHLFKFPSDLAIKNDLEMQAKTNFWLQIANYELESIIQTKTRGLKSTLDEYRNFFNIIWWRNLRTGNWLRFMQLLDKRAKHVRYNVYTGTSGKLRIPVEKRNCSNVTSMELELSVPAVIPQFVWTYLQSTSEDVPEDFVVIAYNSPYVENFGQNSTVICNDMCDEIDWLQPMQDSRHVAAFGRLYCCRSDEVVGLLDDFPLKPSNLTSIATEVTLEN